MLAIRYQEYKQARFNMRIPAWQVVNAMHWADAFVKRCINEKAAKQVRTE